MNAHVIRAIFKRNFVSYFSNPTGYVFICVFVLLSSFAAFWPFEFFNANLANLDELNRYLPYIMLVFIPAITMSIWADERRQGTDELLLTIPAADFDVVLGKYLAAVAIFSVSLVFSLFSNLCVLSTLGEPDIGLLFGTYFGYWIVGLAMLAIGMVASFLTGNLTVGFILGAIFNAPLAFAASAPQWASWLKKWSITEQFRGFGSGVISLAGVAYFVSLVVLMLYLSMVLIGRRHWRGGSEGRAVAGHYLTRFLALGVALFSLNVYLSHHNRARVDVTVEHLSSLSPKTRELIENLETKRPVQIEAYVSKSVPENYVTTKLNLESALREFEAIAGKKIQVTIHEVEPFSEDAARAEKQFGIKPQSVESRSRGARTQEDIFLGVAFSSGLDKVVVPFLSKGVPVEYELVRSIATVSQQKRKRIGVLTTDAKLFAGFDMQSMAPTRDELLIEELRKQYDVVQVDATNPITEHYDVLLAVQPSSLGPAQMTNFVAAVKQGQPTAIFEDPLPVIAADVAGTNAPKQPAGGMFGRQPPQPKGDISQLWAVLGVNFSGDEIIWQDYNPFPKMPFPPELVFIGPAAGEQSFNAQEAISKKLQLLLFPYPGAVSRKPSSDLTFKELVDTGKKTGTVLSSQVIEQSFMGPARLNPELRNLAKRTGEKYVLAAHITGKLKAENLPMSDKAPDGADSDAAETNSADAAAADAAAAEQAPATETGDEAQPGTPDATEKAPPGEKPDAGKAAAAHAALKELFGKSADAAKSPGERQINAVVVGDIDCLYSTFFALQRRGNDPDDELNLDLDNVAFVLNILDVLAGDERFVDIRNRRPAHRELSRITEAKERAKEKVDKVREQATQTFDTAQAEEKKKFADKIAGLKKRKNLKANQALTEIAMAQEDGQRRLEIAVEHLKTQRDAKIKEVEGDLAKEVRDLQDWYKLWAVLLPPIPPLLVGCFVFFNRRAREREGVAKSRLR